MPNNQRNQKTRKGPRRFTPEEIQQLKALQEEHRRKMETDPEYRKTIEKRTETFERIALLNDTFTTK